MYLGEEQTIFSHALNYLHQLDRKKWKNVLEHMLHAHAVTIVYASWGKITICVTDNCCIFFSLFYYQHPMSLLILFT